MNLQEAFLKAGRGKHIKTLDFDKLETKTIDFSVLSSMDGETLRLTVLEIADHPEQPGDENLKIALLQDEADNLYLGRCVLWSEPDLGGYLRLIPVN